MQVYLNVYDVPGGNEQMDSVIQRLNEWGRLAGFGGVFHGAVELDGREWSFGGCPEGSGVYGYEPRRNPMYKFRETVDLGPTNKSKQEVKQILKRLKGEWSGPSYELLSRNCCHFCEAFAQELQVQPVPGWLNRAAASADAAVAFSNKAYSMGSTVGSNITRTATNSYGWLCNLGGMLQQQQQQELDESHETLQESPEGAGENFMRHFSFLGGSAGGNKKPPAKAIWEGGLAHGSPLHAALAQHRRGPAHSGITQLPPHHSRHTTDDSSIDSGNPLNAASTPPEPQPPPDRAATGGVGRRGVGMDMQHPYSVPSAGSGAEQDERPRSAAWLRDKLTGGLQTAAAATAAAASAPSSWFAKDTVQGGRSAASTLPSHSASTAGDATARPDGFSFSHALGSTCRPSTTHSRSSSNSSNCAGAAEKGAKDVTLSSGLSQGMRDAGAGGLVDVFGIPGAAVKEQSGLAVKARAGHDEGLGDFTSIAATSEQQQQQQQQQQHLQEEFDLLGLEVQSEQEAGFGQQLQQLQQPPQQQQQQQPWNTQNYASPPPVVCPEQAKSGQALQKAEGASMPWDESNPGESAPGRASAVSYTDPALKDSLI